MKTFYFIVIYLLCACSFLGVAQISDKSDIKNNKYQYSNIDTLHKYGYYYTNRSKNLDSARFFIHKATEVLDPKDSIRIGVHNDLRGKYFMQKREWDSAKVYFKKGVYLYDALNDKEGLANHYNSLSVIAVRESNYEEGIKQSLKSLNILTEISNSDRIFPQEYNLGMLHIYIKNYKRAKFYLFNSLEKAEEKKDSMWTSYICGALCNVYLKEKQTDSAVVYLEKLKRFRNGALTKNDNYNFFKGQIALETQKYLEAINFFNISLNRENPGKALANTRIAYAYLRLNKPNKTITYLKISDSLLKGKKTNPIIRVKDSLFYEAYKMLGETSTSISYFEKYKIAQEHTLSLKKIHAVNEVERSAEINKREHIISDQSSTIQRYSNNTIFLIIGLGLIMLISRLLLWKSYKKRRILHQEKAFVEAQYKQVNKENIALSEKLLSISKKLNEKGNPLVESRYKRSSLTSEQREDYMNRILEFMETKKPYLDTKLTQKTLSEQLGMSTHHVSEVLNINFGKNFYSFINLYRVEQAKKIIERDTENLTMLAIAYDSGFNSKASFNRVFKDIAGVTPSVYKSSYGKKI